MRGELQRQVEGRVAGPEGFLPAAGSAELTEQYRRTYELVRPHSSLGYRSPLPGIVLQSDSVLMLVGLT